MLISMATSALLYLTVMIFAMLRAGDREDRSERRKAGVAAWSILAIGFFLAVALAWGNPGAIVFGLLFALVVNWRVIPRNAAPVSVKAAVASWGICIAFGSVILAIAPLLQVPKVTLVNDLNGTPAVSGCMDLEVLNEGERKTIRPARPCTVFYGPEMTGCLDIPDEVIRKSGEIRLSEAVPDVSEADCRALDRYTRLIPVRQW